MEVIADLAAFIEATWQKQGQDERAFPEIATEALERYAAPRFVTVNEIVRWFAETPASKLPRQVNIEATFGEPPLTLYAGPQFFIEVLFWLDGTTAVHQHGFSGAFQVLSGSSIHSTFRFRADQRINSRMALGELVFIDSELLEQQAIRPIRSGCELVHSLFHLDRPSVTLVVRTYNEPDVQPQWLYLAPHIAVDPFFKSERLTRLLQTLTMLRRIDSPDMVPLVETIIRGSDFFSAWTVLHHFLTLAPNDGVALDRLLATATNVHGERAQVFSAVLAEVRREHHITNLRRSIHSADHRFFLAALLNLPNQDLIFDFVKRRCPAEAPVDIVLRWIHELSVSGSGTTSPLGIELGDAELCVLRLLLEGRDPDRAVELIAHEYELETGPQDIIALCEALRTSLLLRPLFQKRPVIQRAA